jgi:hypothetical protein
MGLAMNGRAMNFIALDQNSKAGSTADAWVLRVFLPPIVLSAPHDKVRVESAQSFIHWRLDCAHRTARRMSDDAFDADGRWLLGSSIPEPEAPIEANSTQDFLAKFMCDGSKPPQPVIVTGHAAALQLARQARGQGAT